MESTSKPSDSGSDGDTPRGTQGDSSGTTRRKLNDQQEREVTRLYAETETPVSEISKRFGIGESSVYRVAQRHGAALRGRSTTSTGSASRPAAASAAAKPKATTTGTGRGGRRRGAGRTAATTPAAARPAAASSTARAASTPSGNGRRTRGTRGRPAAAITAAATPARRRGAATGRATRAAAKPATRSAGRPRAASAGGTRRSFRVSYVAVRVFVANDMADAIRQATAAGATDITSIARS